jgi:hypothetical protein
MAEYVKWRLTKARAGVTMALFGLLAGLGLRAKESEPASFERAAALTLPKGTRIPANSIGSAQVKFHSLLLSDYKPQTVASYAFVIKERKDLNSLDSLFIKMNDQVSTLSGTLAKVNDELATFETKDDAASTFLLKDATAANAAKVENVGLDGLIQGHGQVLTGEITPSQTTASVLTVPGTLTVQGTKDPAANAIIAVLNTSSQTLLINDGTSTQSVAPGKSAQPVSMGDGSVRVFQVLISGSGGEVLTLTISGYGSGGGEGLVGQALVGTS